MTPEVALIRHGQLCYVLPGLMKYLQKSEKWTRGRACIDDIIRFLYMGRMFLILAYDAETMQSFGYVIAEVTQYPQSKILTTQYCAGEPNHMKLVEEKMHALVDKIAKEMDCSGVEFSGRPGWEKHMKRFGYNAKSVFYVKYFGEDNAK